MLNRTMKFMRNGQNKVRAMEANQEHHGLTSLVSQLGFAIPTCQIIFLNEHPMPLLVRAESALSIRYRF